MSSLTFRLIRRESFNEDADVKKALARSMIYYSILSAIIFLFTILPAASSSLSDALETKGLFAFIFVGYIFETIIYLPTYSLPIFTLVILKPLRHGMKLMFQKAFCSCCKGKIDPPVSLTNIGLTKYPWNKTAQYRSLTNFSVMCSDVVMYNTILAVCVTLDAIPILCSTISDLIVHNGC